MDDNPWNHWFYAGPYIPSGVIYGVGPSSSVWLVPGYEKWIGHMAAIDLYSGPKYTQKETKFA
jgi:hypothetical protein